MVSVHDRIGCFRMSCPAFIVVNVSVYVGKVLNSGHRTGLIAKMANVA